MADIHCNNEDHRNNQETMDTQPIFTNIRCNTTPLTLEDLDRALKLAKNNKQPGPDNVQMELLKWFNKGKRNLLIFVDVCDSL